MVYFDHCATTPPYPEVIRTVTETMERYYGNPASIHRIGLDAEKLLNGARDQMARLLRVHSDELLFTSGGSESNNMAIKGTAWRYRSRGKHLITTQIEHPSVTESYRQLESEGFRVTYLPVDEMGQVRISDLEQALCNDTILVSVMLVNNEVGSIQPISQIGKLLKQRSKVFFHVDAVQGVGKLPLDPHAMGIDMMSASAHKFRGPKGVGFLFRRRGIELEPLIVGGGQEWGMRAGTSNVPLVAGMAKAMRLSVEGLDQNTKSLASLKEGLLRRVLDIPGVYLNGAQAEELTAPHVVNISVPGCKPEVIVHSLEQKGFYVSTKSACASGKETPSKVLLAMGYDRARASSSIRISLGPEHRLEDVWSLADALEAICTELRKQQVGGEAK
jgi:cysteine desulfurase